MLGDKTDDEHMTEEKRNRKVPLALELGYKLSLHATYFDAIQGKSIDAKRLPGTLQHVKEELEVLEEYYLFFFSETIPEPTGLETQDSIREYLASLLRTTKAKMHVRYGDPVEAAFELGSMLAINDLAPPQESIKERFLEVLGDLLKRIDIETDDALFPLLSGLLAEDIEQRANARKELFKEIGGRFGERPRSSWLGWLRGLEITTGVPGVIQVKKTLQ